MAIYNGFFLGVRILARPFTYLHHRPDLTEIPDTAIYICRHRNLRGPIFTMLHLNRQMRPWVFDVFCYRDLCYRQYSGYTFTERLGWPRWWAECVARLASWVVPPMMHAMGAIPVHRGGVIKQTFKQSLEALIKGESVIIYPDIEYTSTSDEPGEMYSGYVALAHMYYRATGKEIRFIPLDIRMKQRAIYLGTPVTYQSGSYLREERVRVSGLLRSELERLGAIEDAPRAKKASKRVKL